MNIFDIIGPVMIGPSSSHTAGAARIGYAAMLLLGGVPARVDITLYESFATTGKGHGTDKAIVGGLLGMLPDDVRLPDSFRLAEAAGLDYRFNFSNESHGHPNTAEMVLWDADGKELQVTGISVGGGNIEITKINGFTVSIGFNYHTLVVFSVDRFGTVAQITSLLSASKVNIAFMRLSRKNEGAETVMVIETDQAIPDTLLAQIKALDDMSAVSYLEAI